MAYRILVPCHTYPDGNSDALAAHVAAAARHLEAEISAVVLIPDFPPLASPLGEMVIDISALVGETLQRCRARGRALLQAIEREAAAQGIAVTSSVLDCNPAVAGDAVAERARYRDLTIVGLVEGDATLQATAEAAVFESGRPVLLVPEKTVPSGFDHVLVAWDGSRVAARAIGDAGVFLARAAKVTVATVVDEKALPGDATGKALVAHLAAHEIKAEVAALRSQGRPVAEVLQDEAKRRGAGLIVMGGFGHSRVRDFVLGGATKGILGGLKVPTLLAH